MFMRTRRLFLRPPFLEDWRAIYAAMNDESLVRMLSRAPWPYEPRDAQAFCEAPHDQRDLRLAVTLPEVPGAPLVGMVGMDLSQPAPELGYWIGRNFQGQGLASEAARGICEMARALGVRRIQAGHYLDNPASGAVLRKCGFVPTGAIEPTHALGRGGTMVLARRYALDLAENAETRPEKAMRKPA